ncbi:hypothetical protein K438DRAFT_272942 [Mycena galopus ATCC 62051]|nr:hypothetical protein K438DRAFT_272942 [Mycena galopus ATCC 62051]
MGVGPIHNLLLSAITPLLLWGFGRFFDLPFKRALLLGALLLCGVSRASSSSPKVPGAPCVRNRPRDPEPDFWIGPVSFLLIGSVDFFTNR